MPIDIAKLPKPQNFNKFSVAKGTGVSYANLASSLNRAMLSSSDTLHPLKEYKDHIIEAFDNPLYKKKMRSGGLSNADQKLLFRKIIAKNKKLSSDQFAKNILKNRLLKHFEKRPEVQDRIEEQFSEDIKTGGTASRSAIQHKSTSETIGKKDLNIHSGIGSIQKNNVSEKTSEIDKNPSQKKFRPSFF
ncbi:MAG: hypothetical protein ABH832_04775 [bacterium]